MNPYMVVERHELLTPLTFLLVQALWRTGFKKIMDEKMRKSFSIQSKRLYNLLIDL